MTENRSHEGLRYALALLIVSSLVSARAEIKLEPSIAVSALYVDNINLAPPGAAKEGDFLAELTPRLVVEQKSANLVSALDYSLQSLFFLNRTDLNSYHHNAQGNASWSAVPDWLYLEGSASYIEQTIDPTRPGNTDNLFNVKNTADQFIGLIAPYLKHDFDGVTGLLRYSWSTSRYTGVPDTVAADSFATNLFAANYLQNSRTSAASLQVTTTDPDARLAWSVDGSSARTTFDTAEPFRTDRATLEGSMAVYRSLRLVATVGAESNVLKNQADGGLNAGFYSVGVRWAPSDRGELDARVGHRFFGTAYALHWTRQTRVLKLDAQYTEEPTTDGENSVLQQFVPGVITPTTVYSTTVLHSTFSPYLRKQAEGTVTLISRRTEVDFQAYRVEQNYFSAIDFGRNDVTMGGALAVTRTLSFRDKLRLTYKQDRTDLSGGFGYQNRRYIAELTRAITAASELDLQVTHLQSTGNLSYRVNIAMLTWRKKF